MVVLSPCSPMEVQQLQRSWRILYRWNSPSKPVKPVSWKIAKNGLVLSWEHQFHAEVSRPSMQLNIQSEPAGGAEGEARGLLAA